MKTLYFNFNNEVDTFEIQQDEETGRVNIPGVGGPQYDSLQQFAEMYAVARDVTPEHLKNWTLVENGDVVSFVLRAGTAGVAVIDIQDKVDAVLEQLRTEGVHHPLDVERVRRELVGSTNVMESLALSAVPNVARVVYDLLATRDAFVEPEPEPEEVDERSDIERYLDSVQEMDRSLAFFAKLLNMDSTATKDQILNALESSTIPYTVSMLRELYENALTAASVEGINVNTRFESILVVSQAVPGEPSEDAKTKIITTANLAKRDQVNMTAYVVGQHHIRKTAMMATIMELNDMDVYMLGNIPITVSFNPAVDEELEEERRREEEEAERDYEPEDELETETDEWDDEDYYEGDDPYQTRGL